MGLAETFLIGLCLNVSCRPETKFVSEDFQAFHNENVFQKSLYFKRLENELRDQHLNIATIQNGALSRADKINGIWAGKGAAFDVIALLQKIYRFNYTVILPKENSLGSKNTGIFGLIYNKKADLGAAFLPITSTYWQYGHFAATLDVGEWVAVLKRPKESASGSGLLAPFDAKVWILVLISVVAVGPVIYLIISAQFKTGLIQEVRKISFSDCAWFVYGALLKQGTTLTPISDTTRLLLATWWIFITILTAFYTANLTAFLTLSEFTLPIKNPKDIATKRFPWVAISGGMIEEASTNKLEELYTTLKASQRKFVKEDSNTILNTWVSKQNYIYISDRPNVDILLHRDFIDKTKNGFSEAKRCTYVVTPWTVFKRPRTFAYSKSFKYGELFDRTLRNLVEFGLVKYHLTKTLPDVKICPLNLGTKERRLRNNDLLLTYYIVGLGFLVASFMFLIEIILQYLKRGDNVTSVVPSNAILERINDFKELTYPPPAYNTLFLPSVKSNRKRRYVNGRYYWVNEAANGGTKLIPIGTPSALLFVYKR